MTIPSRLTVEQWAEVGRLLAEGAMTSPLAARFGIGNTTLRKHAEREGWIKVTPRTRSTAAGSTHRASKSSGTVGTSGIRSRLALRLYSVIECKIKMMELRMTKQLQAHEAAPDGSIPPAPGKDERESFAALIESINKVTEMASEPAPRSSEPGQSGQTAAGRRKSAAGPVSPELAALSADIDADGLAVASEKDALRREIAERLERIFPSS